MTARSVTCVIVAFHRPDPLARLLDGLERADVEVVVVNVDADEAVRQVLAQRRFATGLEMKNRGYAAAVNRGVEKATTGAVVFMNDDISVEGEVVAELGRRARAQHGAVVPMVRDPSGRVEPTLHPFASWRSLLLEWALLPDAPPSWARRLPVVRKWRRPTETTPIDAAAAPVVGVPTRILRSIPMPEDYFMYWEDNEWFWRLRRAGVGAVYAPELLVTHHGGRDDVRAEKSALLARNAVRCVRRIDGRSGAALAIPVVVLWSLRLLVADLVRAPLVRPIRRRLPGRVAGLRAALGSWRELR